MQAPLQQLTDCSSAGCPGAAAVLVFAAVVTVAVLYVAAAVVADVQRAVAAAAVALCVVAAAVSAVAMTVIGVFVAHDVAEVAAGLQELLAAFAKGHCFVED